MVKKQPEKEKWDFPLFLLISKQTVELTEHFYENIHIKLKTLHGAVTKNQLSGVKLVFLGTKFRRAERHRMDEVAGCHSSGVKRDFLAAQQRPAERPDMDVWAGGISSGTC